MIPSQVKKKSLEGIYKILLLKINDNSDDAPHKLQQFDVQEAKKDQLTLKKKDRLRECWIG